MNEEQKLRLELLAACNYDIEAARKCWDFVCGDKDKKQESACDRLTDGIYLINEYEEIVPFDDKEKVGNGLITHIGIVRGDHSVAIATHDVSEYEITLTTGNDDGKGHYIDNCMSAVQDWNGQKNTEHLQAVGLNSSIQLKEGEYIPSLAELCLICLNQGDINEAMRFVGGQEMKDRYWSSTEHNASYEWTLELNLSYPSTLAKKANSASVRTVKKFL